VCGQELSNFRSAADFQDVGLVSSQHHFYKQQDVCAVLELIILFGNLVSFYYPEILFLGVFAKLRKSTINFIISLCSSVRLSLRPREKNRIPTGQIFLESDI
jgi:hypothetical protein